MSPSQSTTIRNYSQLLFFYPQCVQNSYQSSYPSQCPDFARNARKTPALSLQRTAGGSITPSASADGLLPRWWHSTNPQYTLQAVTLRTSRETTPETEEPIQSPLDGKEYRHAGHQSALLRFIQTGTAHGAANIRLARETGILIKLTLPMT